MYSAVIIDEFIGVYAYLKAAAIVRYSKKTP
jgi:hypothetical protein